MFIQFSGIAVHNHFKHSPLQDDFVTEPHHNKGADESKHNNILITSLFNQDRIFSL